MSANSAIEQLNNSVRELTAETRSHLDQSQQRVDDMGDQVNDFITGARDQFPAINLFDNALLFKTGNDNYPSDISIWQSNISVTLAVEKDEDVNDDWWWLEARKLRIVVTSNSSENTKYGSLCVGDIFAGLLNVYQPISKGFEYKVISNDHDSNQFFIDWESPRRIELEKSQSWTKAKSVGKYGAQNSAFCSFYMAKNSRIEIEMRNIWITLGYYEKFCFPLSHAQGK